VLSELETPKYFKYIQLKINMKNIYFLFLMFLLKTHVLAQVTIASTDASCTNGLFLGVYPKVSERNWEKSTFNIGTTNTITIAPTGVGGTWTIIRTFSRVDLPDVVTVWYTNPSTSVFPPTTGWLPTGDGEPCPPGTFSVTVNSLPLELISFSIQKREGGNQLIWQTSSEVNTHSFDIERSTDGIAFQSIGAVKTVGNSKTTQFYFFNDKNPISSNYNYYRLKVNDLDNTFTFSKVISVENPKRDNIMIRQNRSGEIVIETEDNIQLVTIFNLFGQIVRTASKARVSIQDLPFATYIISVKTDYGYLSEKITKF
jgi:hypothetical protein